VIQRWLVLFARQHLHAICNKLMTVADASDKQDEALAAEKNPRRKRQVLPSLSAGGGGGSGGSGGGGGKTNVTLSTRMPFAAKPPPLPAVDATDTVAFFLLDCLRRVLAAAADVEALRGKGSGLGGYSPAADATSPGSRDHARRPMGHLGPGGGGEMGRCVGRCGEVWGGVGRCGEVWGDIGHLGSGGGDDSRWPEMTRDDPGKERTREAPRGPEMTRDLDRGCSCL